MKGSVRSRWLRALAAAGAAGAVAVGTAACEPSGYSNTSAIAVTTDQQGTRALKWESVDVSWLSCTASAPNGGEPVSTAGSNPRSAAGPARVDCQGQTASGERITITGNVTREVSGRCVEGNNLVARVGDRVIFRTTTIGNCNAPASGSTDRPNSGSSSRPARDDNSNSNNDENNNSNNENSNNENNNSDDNSNNDNSGNSNNDNSDGNNNGSNQNDDQNNNNDQNNDDQNDNGNDKNDNGKNGNNNQDDCADDDQGNDDQDNGKDNRNWDENNGDHGKDVSDARNGGPQDRSGTWVAR